MRVFTGIKSIYTSIKVCFSIYAATMAKCQFQNSLTVFWRFFHEVLHKMHCFTDFVWYLNPY